MSKTVLKYEENSIFKNSSTNLKSNQKFRKFSNGMDRFLKLEDFRIENWKQDVISINGAG